MSDATPSPWGAFALSQLTGSTPEPVPVSFNPRPPGLLHVGSASTAVLAFLQDHPGRWFTFGQLLIATDRSAKSLDFACRMLRSIDRVDMRHDESRNPRYFRYCFKQVQAAEGNQP